MRRGSALSIPMTRATAPRRARAHWAESFLCERRIDGGRVDAHQILKGFIDRTDRVPQLIEGFVPETAWLSDAGIVGNSASNVCEMLYLRAIQRIG
jgi:hypothetical protein